MRAYICLWWYYCIFQTSGSLYNSQLANRSAAGEGGSHREFSLLLLFTRVIHDSQPHGYVFFFITIRIRVKHPPKSLLSSINIYNYEPSTSLCSSGGSLIYFCNMDIGHSCVITKISQDQHVELDLFNHIIIFTTFIILGSCVSLFWRAKLAGRALLNY